MRRVKPVLLGYQVVRVSTSAQEVERGRLALQEYCDREHFALGQIFVEDDVNSPCSALVALIEAAQREIFAAIAVPSLSDLGQLPRVQQLTRQRLVRETGLRVLVVS